MVRVLGHEQHILGKGFPGQRVGQTAFRDALPDPGKLSLRPVPSHHLHWDSHRTEGLNSPPQEGMPSGQLVWRGTLLVHQPLIPDRPGQRAILVSWRQKKNKDLPQSIGSGLNSPQTLLQQC